MTTNSTGWWPAWPRVRGAILVALSVSAWAGTAGAQTAPVVSAPAAMPTPAEALLEPVEVVGLKHPASASYLTLQAGANAFDKYRKLAPEASLRFTLRPSPGAPPLGAAPLLLKLEAPSLSLPVPLDAEQSFTLPEPALVGAAAKDSTLVANRRAGTLRVLSLVRTPGLAPEVRRLGDLRLQCEVNWALEKEGMSFVVRGALNLAGGFCRSSYIGIGFSHQSQKIAEAVLSHGERRQVLPLGSEGLTYLPPLWDKAWPDDALVTLRLAGQPG